MENRIERMLITPAEGDGFNMQLMSILEQIKAKVTANDRFILQISFFIDARNNNEYIERYETITKALEEKLSVKPSRSIIAQPPANGIQMSVELILLADKGEETTIYYKEEQGIPYALVESKNSTEVYAGGISSKRLNTDFSVQVDESFRLMKSILEAEGLTFSDVVRQWNYVEGILKIHGYGKEYIQHYQILNDMRSKYYAEAEFQMGYPAATGIGMDAGGLILEFYAVKPLPSIDIIPIKNPKQVDAYHYSEQVLVGDALVKHRKKSTPKFERAKYSHVNGVRSIYISGTASIQSEKTIGVDNIRLQTEITLDNIANLIAKANLVNVGISNVPNQLKYTFIRVYIKDRKEIDIVRKICDAHYGDIPVHYLVADICRENLLLEIEGVAELA